MSLLSRSGALTALVLVAFLAFGCGGTVIDLSKVEDQIEANVENTQKTKVSSVDCPSGVEVKAGASFDCAVTLTSGKQQTVTLKILNSDADVEITSLKANK